MVEVIYYDLDRESHNFTELSCSGAADISDISKFGDGQKLLDNVDTPNYFSFDGDGIDLNTWNKTFYSSGDYVGYISSDVSDEQGKISGHFGLSLKIIGTDDLDFHKGITFVFYGNCCKKIYVMYRNSNTESIWEEEIIVDSENFTLVPYVNSASIEIYFLNTTLPYQSIKISNIIIGRSKVFNKFQNINLLEEINILSEDLPINSLDFTVITDEEVIVGNPVTVYSNGKYYGMFYIDEAEYLAKNIYSVSALNKIKILDNKKYYDWHVGLDLDEFSSQIKSDTGISIKIDKPEDISYSAFGYIPIDSYRYALCLYSFACRLMIDGSRSNNILLKPIPEEITSVIKTEDKRIIGECKFTKVKPITQAKMQYAQGYTFSDESITVKCEPNVSTLIYSETPIEYVYDDQPDNEQSLKFEVQDYSGNWIKVVSYTDESICIKFLSSIYTYQNITINNSESINTSNEKDFSKFNMRGVSVPSGGGLNTQLPEFKKIDILKYMKSKGTAKAKIRLRNERVGDLIQIETAHNGMITGIITSMNISFGYEDIADIEVFEWQNG